MSALGGLHTLDISDTDAANVSALVGLHELDIRLTHVGCVDVVARVPVLHMCNRW